MSYHDEHTDCPAVTKNAQGTIIKCLVCKVDDGTIGSGPEWNKFDNAIQHENEDKPAASLTTLEDATDYDSYESRLHMQALDEADKSHPFKIKGE